MFMLFLVISLIKMILKHHAEVSAKVLQIKKATVAMWRKYACWISFIQACVIGSAVGFKLSINGSIVYII